MTSTSDTAEWRLVYRNDLNAIVCVDCQQALSYGGLKRHGYRKHLAVSLRARRRVIESLPLEARTATIAGIRYPAAPIAPLEILKEPVAGFRCRGCGQVAVYKNHLEDLCALGECGPFDLADRFERCLAQFLVAEPKYRKYFCVRMLDVQPLRPESAMTDQFLREEKEFFRELNDDPVPVSPSSEVLTEWMRETGWIEYCQVHGFTLRQLHGSAAYFAFHPRGDHLSQHGILFEQCRDKVEGILDRMYRGGDLARRVLCNFNNSESTLNGPTVRRPFRQETVKAHARLWARFVVFCADVKFRYHLSAGCVPRPQTNHNEPIIKFTEEQGVLLNQLDDGYDVLAELSLSFIRCGQFHGHGLGESPLLVFLMVASLTESYDWKPIQKSASIFASLLHVIQGFLYHASAQAHPELKRDFLDHLKEQCARWLTFDRPTVGSRILRILREGRRLAPQQIHAPLVTWSDDGQSITFEAQTMALADLRRFLHGVLGEAEEIMRDLVLFQRRVALEDIITSQQLAGLCDNMADVRREYNVLHDSRNDLEKYADRNLQAIQLDPELRTMWVTGERFDGDVDLSVYAIHEYLFRRNRFLEVLAVLFILLSGSPPRATEVLGAQWANSMQKRGLFALNGRLMLLIGYSQAGNHQSLPRFMPERVLRLYVLYLAVVQPFAEELFFKGNVDTEPVEKSLFFDERGFEMRDSNVAHAMLEATSKHLGLPLTVQAWRHVAFAIYRRKISPQSQVVARLLETTGLCDSDTEEEEDDEEGPVNAIDEAASLGRSVPTGRLRYALGLGIGSNLEWTALKHFQHCSVLWHEYWGVDRPARSSEPPRAVDDGVVDEVRLLAALRAVYGPEATWRSEEQRRALVTVFCGWRQHVAVVLPSGGGKSSLIWVAAKLEADQGLTTVVVVPLSLQIPDLLAKARELGIDAEQWVANHDDRRGWPIKSTLLFVSADMMGNDEFIGDLNAMQSLGWASRVIIDEVHLERCQAGFRPSMDNVHGLEHPVSQLVLLTATLPPEVVDEVFESLQMPRDSTVVVRGETSRPNITYAVQQCGTRHELESAVLRHRLDMDFGTRAVVYCREFHQVVDWANRLTAHWYHRSLDGAAEQLRQWIAGEGSPVLVATTASSCGVYADKVALVLHIERPYDFLEFVQATESAGRPQNAAARSVILTSDVGNAQFQLFQSSQQGPADLAMSEYLEGLTCRRQVISEFMDNPSAWRFRTTTCRDYQVQPCDVCVAAARLGGRIEVTPSATPTATPGSIIQAVSRLVAPFAT